MVLTKYKRSPDLEDRLRERLIQLLNTDKISLIRSQGIIVSDVRKVSSAAAGRSDASTPTPTLTLFETPFYERHIFAHLTDSDGKTSRLLVATDKIERGQLDALDFDDVNVLDDTNRTIYEFNDRSGKLALNASRDRVIRYAYFFFQNVVSRALGGFILLADSDHLVELVERTLSREAPEALQVTLRKIRDAFGSAGPHARAEYFGWQPPKPDSADDIEKSGFFRLRLPILFKHGLFVSDVRVSPNGDVRLENAELIAGRTVFSKVADNGLSQLRRGAGYVGPASFLEAAREQPSLSRTRVDRR